MESPGEMEEVAIRPLGLEETVHAFEITMLESTQSHQDVQIVGIVGSGGSGKTTLAKELYCKKCLMMKRSSFLSRVRSTAAENALINLQKKLLGDLLPDSLEKDLPFCSIDDGKIIVASRLRSVRVLLVLDDVDHVDQLNALLPRKGNLARGSLIIVTARHSDVLTSWGIRSIYRMEGLDRPHAEHLFCKHAFSSSSPPDVFKLLVEKYVSLFQRLPLTLKVLGQLLQGECQQEWFSQLFKMQRISPIDIKEMLRLNFHKLNEEEQEIFLDTACFFIGEEKSVAIAFWVGLGMDGMHSWEMLVNKGLVELDEKKRIRMHDDLREFARELANSRSPYRIWSPEQIVNIQKQSRHKMAIRGIMAATSQFVVCSAHEEFPTYSDSYKPPFKDCMELIEKSSRSLKPLSESSDGDESDLLSPSSEDESELHFPNRSANLLSAFSDEDESEFHSSSRSLKPLPPSSHTTSLFYPHIGEKLIEKPRISLKSSPPRPLKLPTASSIGLYLLVVKGSDFTKEYAALSEDLIWLRWFDFNHSSLPPWLSLKNLRVLELCNALRLKELWPSNASPPFELRELIISSSCGSSFESFPPSISKLRYLRKIALKGRLGDEFRIQGLPDEFCLLQALEHLELRHFKALSSLPIRFGDLRNLQHLDLCSCEALRTLPLSFRHLINLQYLDLSGCKKLAFTLDILEDMTSLEYLNLSGCPKLQKLPNIKNQACLRQLHLQDTNLLDIPSNIDQLTKLQVLTIGSPLLTSLPDSLRDLSSLKSLSIVDCIDLEALPPSLEHLNLLESLYIKSSEMRSLAIWQFANLRTLTIRDCPIGELDFGLGHSMKKLKLINVSQTYVRKISISKDCCPMLEILQLEQNKRLVKIEILPTTVKIVELSNCELLNDISGIDDLVNLQIFEKSGCPQLHNTMKQKFAIPRQTNENKPKKQVYLPLQAKLTSSIQHIECYD